GAGARAAGAGGAAAVGVRPPGPPRGRGDDAALGAREPGGDALRRPRGRGPMPEDPSIHAALLTYASDRGVIATARIPHGGRRGGWASASLEHAIWFHRPPAFDDWLLYTSESPVAHNARALIFGQMYRRDGTRVASVVQEGLIRTPRP